MNALKCRIRKKECGPRPHRQIMASPDNPYIGGDYSDGFFTPFTPDQLVGPTLYQWVEADFIEGVNDGETVETWLDQTAFNNDFTQATANRRPTYKTNILNGYPALRFETANSQGMVSSLNLIEDFINSETQFTVYIVYNHRGATPAFRRAFVGTFLNWLIGPYNGFHQVFTGVAFIQGPAVVQNEFVVAYAQQQILAPAMDNLVEFYVNGTFIGDDNPDTEPDFSGLAGSNAFGEPLDGDIIGMLIYGGLLSASQLTQVANYWNNKYQIY